MSCTEGQGMTCRTCCIACSRIHRVPLRMCFGCGRVSTVSRNRGRAYKLKETVTVPLEFLNSSAVTAA
jgi:hypothetical protein